MGAAAAQLVSTPEAAAVMLEPARARLLAALGEPASATELARRLDLPRQRVNYHLRELERVGAVELAEERRKGNCIERVVRRSAAAYLIDPSIMGVLGETPGERRDRFSWGHLVSSLGRAIADLATLRRRADGAGKRLATLSIEVDVAFESPAAMHNFANDAANALAELASRYHADGAHGARTYRFILAGMPAVTKTEAEAAAEAASEQDPQQDDKE